MLDFLKRKKTPPEQKFWEWVVQHKLELENFILSDQKNFNIYNQLTKEMKQCNTLLFPEMTVTKKNEIVLIITPDGMRDGVIPTQKLFDAKPKLDNWVVKKFRQPSDEIELNFQGLEYPSSDIRILAEIDQENEKVDTLIFIKNMNAEVRKHQSLAFLYLDHILGEFNVITRVGHIEFRHLDSNNNVEDGISILELRSLIDKEIYEVGD